MKHYLYRGFCFDYNYDEDQDHLEIYYRGDSLGDWVCLEAGPINQIEAIADVFLFGLALGEKL